MSMLAQERIHETRSETCIPPSLEPVDGSLQMSSTSERQAYLRQAYFFRCECAACRPPSARTATMPSRRPNDDEGDDEQRLAARDSGERTTPAACSKRTDFSCTKAESGGCPGTLVVGMLPPPLSSPIPPATKRDSLNPDDGARAISPGTFTDPAAARASSSSSSSSSVRGAKMVLWCDRCGNYVPPVLADALLKEDEDDRRLWDKAMLAISSSEEGAGGGISGRDEGGVRIKPPPRRSRSNTERSCESSPGAVEEVPSSSYSSDSSDPLSLVVERIRWRESHLTTASMRRAVAHDMHARILANREDFSGAADACARAVNVLKKRFAPSDQELGIEFLKLAELCFNAGWTNRCRAACVKARVSLGVCLQPGDEQLVTLNTLQALCGAIQHQ